VVVDVGKEACQMMIDPEGGHEVVSIFLPNLPEPGHRREGKQDGRQDDLFKVPTEFLFQQEVKSKDALEEPLRQIVQNAGHEGAIVVAKIRDSKNPNFGFNADTEVYEDLVDAGVIDPTMVARTALENAASIAGLLLTTEALITDVPEDEKAAGPGGGAPDMGGMGGMGGMY